MGHKEEARLDSKHNEKPLEYLKTDEHLQNEYTVYVDNELKKGVHASGQENKVQNCRSSAAISQDLASGAIQEGKDVRGCYRSCQSIDKMQVKGHRVWFQYQPRVFTFQASVSSSEQ